MNAIGEKLFGGAPVVDVAYRGSYWDARASAYVGPGEDKWARQEPTWGIWRVPDAELHVLPEDLAGKDAIELRCGTAYVSAWLARRGARVDGIDTSAAQLATARRLQRELGLALMLIHGGPWMPATIDRREEAAFAWKIWSLEWQKAATGEHTIVSRAIDTQGNI